MIWLEVQIGLGGGIGGGEGFDDQDGGGFAVEEASLNAAGHFHPLVVGQGFGVGPADDEADRVGVGHAATDDETADQKGILDKAFVTVDEADDAGLLAVE